MPTSAAIAPPAIPASQLREEHARELVRRLGQPLLGGNHVELLEGAGMTFATMFRAIDAARDHVNVESYTLQDGGAGEEFAARLAARCRRGVRVNLLFDSIGSLATRARFFEQLRRAGASLCEYNPLPRWPLPARQLWHRRDHRKLMVVDGRTGFIGGVNISPVYGSAPGGDADAGDGWRDLHLMLHGPAVHRLQRMFIDHWRRHAPLTLPQARYFPPLACVGGHRVGVAASEAGSRRSAYFSALLGAIDTARSRVLLTTAYLVPPRRLLRRLAAAAARGVTVELLLPGVSDSWPALHAGRSHYAPLLRAGVRIHERRDRLQHAKACVIDGVWASVGSSNIDWRSWLHNAEADLVIVDEAFADRLETVLRSDIAQAQPVELAGWEARSCWLRCKETLARRFEFLL